MIILMAVVFFVIGLGLFAFLVRNINRAKASLRWSQTGGKISYSGTHVVDTSTSPHRHDGMSATMIDVRYSYKVDGQDYEGTRVTFSDNVVKTGGALSQMQEDFPEGSTIPVYFNPEDPSRAVLVQGTSWYNYGPLVTASIFMGIGAAMFAQAQGWYDVLGTLKRLFNS